MTRILLLFAVSAALSCGPSRKPTTPADSLRPGVKPTRTSTDDRPPSGRAPAQEVLLGEMCPTAAESRPGVLPMVVRRLVWSADADDVGRPLQARVAKQFSVYAWDGRRAGVFSVAGAADVGLAAPVAIGSYAGAMPCDAPRTGGATKAPDPECMAAQRNCGVALSVLRPSSGLGSAPYEEDPSPDEFEIGGGCVAGGQLRVDIDGDGAVEAYSAQAFVADLFEPAEEVTAVNVGEGACDARFSARGVVAAGDPRDWLGLDLIGVVDIDADGRKELVLAFRYAGRSTWGVYSARDTAARLELVAESVPWEP